MDITHLRRLVVTATDPVELAQFYTDVWGLEEVAVVDGPTGPSVYLRGSGDEHHILVVKAGRGASLQQVSLGLADREAVDRAAAELAERDDVTVVRAPSEMDEPGGGYGMAIADVDGRVLELSAEVALAEPSAATDDRPRPRKISHVVLNSPDADAYGELLIDVLGMRLADEMPHMSFFRCNEDHHSIAVARAPHASLNHIAFELADADAVLAGREHMTSLGFETLWGPGRHGPGYNVFSYFVAPNGQVVEYTAELEQVDEANPPEPRLWGPDDYELYDDWASPDSLRPTTGAREVMLGEPEEFESLEGSV